MQKPLTLEKYKKSDALAIIVSVVSVGLLILASRFSQDEDIKIVDTLRTVSIGLVSYFFLFYLLRNRISIFRIPAIVLVVTCGSVLWYFLGFVLGIILEHGWAEVIFLSNLEYRLVLFSLFFILFVPFNVFVTGSFVCIFRFVLDIYRK